MRVVTGLLVLALTSGCAGDPVSAPPGAPAPSTAPAPDPAPEVAPDPAPPPGPPPRPPATPDPGLPVDCDTTTRAAIGAVLGAQLDAFAAEDLAAAYALTSPFFRTFLSEEAFGPLIRDEYATLLGNAGHRFDECRVLGRRAFMVVGVRGADAELVLRYDLSEEPDGWRIDGARKLDGIVLPPDPLV